MDQVALKETYKAAKAAWNSAESNDGINASEKEQLHNEWKIAKRAYKKSKKTDNNDDDDSGSLPVFTSVPSVAKEDVNEEDVIAQANAAFFEAENPVDQAPTASDNSVTNGDETTSQKKKRKRKRKRKGASDESDSNGKSLPAASLTGEERKFHSMGKKLEVETLTVFVGGISYDATEEDLSDFFASCGKINSVRVPKYQDSGKPRGYAHIDFATEEGVKKAIAKNRERMMGRYLDIKIANRRRSGGDFDVSEKPPGCTTIFIKNLPYDTNEKEVFESFQFCGKISEVRLVKWQHTNKLKGIGYVQFQKEESAEIAVKKRAEIQVGGRSVMIDFEGGKPKASYRDTEGRAYKKTNSFSNKRARSTNGPKL